MRYKLTIRFELKDAIIFSAASGDRNVTESLDYIPGTSVLGAFANQFISQNPGMDAPHLNPGFRSFFLDEKMIFTNACITGTDTELAAIPTPFALQIEKHGGTSVYNLLHSAAPPDVLTRPIGGYATMTPVKEAIHLQKNNISKGINFHHERDDQTGTSKNGVIFNYEYLEAGQAFAGELLGDQQTLQTFYNQFHAVDTLRLGRSKNAQYGGRVKVTLSQPEPVESAPKHPDYTSAMLVFTSNSILLNEYGYAVTDVGTLAAGIGKTLGTNVTVDGCVLRTDRSEQYVSVMKMKKPSNNEIKAGSSITMKFHPPVPAEKLMELEYSGIGERRAEGYGRFKILPQNSGYTLSLPEIPAKNVQVVKPSSLTPAAKSVLSKVAADLVQNAIELKAMNLTAKVYGTLTSSQLGRIESMVKRNLNQPAAFKTECENFRPAVKKRYEAVYVHHISFYKFLTSDDPQKMVTEAIDEAEGLRNFLQEIAALGVKDPSHKTDITGKFLLTFLSALRKKNKQSKGGKK